MTRTRTRIVLGGASCACLLMLGFIVFAGVASRGAPASVERADAIVVLTGGERRIEEGVRLLRSGLGRRLLVSGVNPITSREDVKRSAQVSDALFRCCVDFDYVAQTTFGNAEETRQWASRHGFGRLIVVTSSYHMPRSLTELGRVLPDVELVGYPVKPRSMQGEAWWLNAHHARVLAAEYLKMLPSMARFIIARVLRPLETSAGSISAALR